MTFDSFAAINGTAAGLQQCLMKFWVSRKNLKAAKQLKSPLKAPLKVFIKVIFLFYRNYQSEKHVKKIQISTCIDVLWKAYSFKK